MRAYKCHARIHRVYVSLEETPRCRALPTVQKLERPVDQTFARREGSVMEIFVVEKKRTRVYVRAYKKIYRATRIAPRRFLLLFRICLFVSVSSFLLFNSSGGEILEAMYTRITLGIMQITVFAVVLFLR